MGLDKIGSGLSAAWHKAQHLVGDAAHAVEREGAKIAQDVAQFGPVAERFPTVSDYITRECAPLTEPGFPRKLDVGTPRRFATLEPGKAAPLLGDSGVHMTPSQPVTTVGVHLDQAGDAQLDLKAAGPGTDWGKKGAESAVMSVYVDGKYQQDVVLWGGGKETPYSLSLGSLPAGDHTVSLRYSPEKSAKGAQGVSVTAASATSAQYATPQDRYAAQYAPILIGRGGLDNNHTDVPLGLFHRIDANPDGTTTISYGYAYSNEDEGTGLEPSMEQARWGRLSDLETVYKVTVDSNGKLLDSQYEGVAHHWHPFDGVWDGSHAVIRTATQNNNVSDSGTGPMRFQLPTRYPLAADTPVEDLMRQHPEWTAVMGKELQREGKIDPQGKGDRPDPTNMGTFKALLGQAGILSDNQMADPRQYLYVQFKAEGTDQGSIEARVVLKDGRVLDSNFGVKAASVDHDGWAQTAILLPLGTRPEDIARLEFPAEGEAREVGVGHVFTLHEDYQPREVKLPN